jgi:hypothetical protein
MIKFIGLRLLKQHHQAARSFTWIWCWNGGHLDQGPKTHRHNVFSRCYYDGRELMFNSRTRAIFFISALLLFLYPLSGVPRAFATVFLSGFSLHFSCSAQADFGTPDSDSDSSSGVVGNNPPVPCNSAGEYDDFYGEGRDAFTAATASATASVGVGSAGVQLETSATSTPLIDGAIAKANAGTHWFDTLIFTGRQGQLLRYRFTESINGSMTCTGETDGDVSFDVSWGNGSFSTTDHHCLSPLGSKNQATVTFLAGSLVLVQGDVSAQAVAVAGNNIADEEILSSQNVSAGDTFSLFITPITPGASYISASGHDYAPPSIPEPSSLLLMATSLAVVFVFAPVSRRVTRAGVSPAADRFRYIARGRHRPSQGASPVY